MSSLKGDDKFETKHMFTGKDALFTFSAAKCQHQRLDLIVKRRKYTVHQFLPMAIVWRSKIRDGYPSSETRSICNLLK